MRAHRMSPAARAARTARNPAEARTPCESPRWRRRGERGRAASQEHGTTSVQRTWQGTIKRADVKVVNAPASTVTPIVVAASFSLPSRSSACSRTGVHRRGARVEDRCVRASARDSTEMCDGCEGTSDVRWRRGRANEQCAPWRACMHAKGAVCSRSRGRSPYWRRWPRRCRARNQRRPAIVTSSNGPQLAAARRKSGSATLRTSNPPRAVEASDGFGAGIGGALTPPSRDPVMRATVRVA